MILFLQDWARFPTATVHWETTNESFLDVARLYKGMGVNNALFMLALLQPELRHVDPFAKDLPLDIQEKIAIECKYNPWYYYREIVRYTNGGGARPFKANRANISMIWCFYNHIDYFLIQPRQTGKSGSADAIANHCLYFGMTGGRYYLITKDSSLRKENIERLKGMRDALPTYLWAKDRNDADNQSELSYNALGNRYSTAVAQKTVAGALLAARGGAAQIMQFDEVPFCANIHITWASALAAGTKAREIARDSGQPYSNIFTTTAGKKDTDEGKFVYDILSDAATFNEAFYDQPDLDTLVKVIRKLIGKASARLLINGTWNYRQLGLSEEWLREALINAGATGEDADRDFFNRWTSGSLRSPLSTELNEIIHQSEAEPVWVDIHRDGYSLGWYTDKAYHQGKMDAGPIILGMDTSNAVGCDRIGLVFTDPLDMSTIGAGSVTESNLIKFADYVCELMLKYPTLILVIENKSSAQTVIDALLLRLPYHGLDPFKRMFNRVVDETDTNKNYYQYVNTPLNRRPSFFYDEIRNLFGFITTGGSRYTLFGEILPEAAKKSGHLVRNPRLVSEILALVVKNGRIDHQSSGHDDMVISWLLTFWFVLRARNLSHYGINRHLVFSRVATPNATQEEITLANEQALQSQYRLEMDRVVEDLKATNDYYVISKLEHRLSLLGTRLSGLTGEVISINDLLEDIREDRRRKTAVKRFRSQY